MTKFKINYTNIKGTGGLSNWTNMLMFLWNVPACSCNSAKLAADHRMVWCLSEFYWRLPGRAHWSAKKETINKYCASFDFIRFQCSQCSMSNRENNNVLLIQPFQCEDPLYTSESDVYRRHILTYKDGPRNDIFKREGDVALWLERLTASPVMHASRFRTPLFPCGVFRETTLFLPSRCH